jgi:LruC domain-containing protein
VTSEAGQSALTLILVPSTQALGYHSHWCWFFNTQDCKEVEPPRFAFELEFAEPIPQADLGDAPYNPFIHRTADRRYEVHLPNHPPTDRVPSWVIGFGDDDSDPSAGRYLLSKDSRPWALNLPVDWRHPREWVPVSEAYDGFVPWAESSGDDASDWYLIENANADRLFQRTITDSPE